MIRIAITAAAHDAHLARRWPHPRRSNRPMRLMNLPSRERPPMASPNAKCRNPRPSCSLWVAAEGPKRSFVLRAVGSYRRSSKAAAISVVLRTRSLGEHDQKGRRLDRRRLKKKVERHRGSRVGRARGSNRACRSPFLLQHRHKSPPTRSTKFAMLFLASLL
jgi:hypothetical protein